MKNSYKIGDRVLLDSTLDPSFFVNNNNTGINFYSSFVNDNGVSFYSLGEREIGTIGNISEFLGDGVYIMNYTKDGEWYSNIVHISELKLQPELPFEKEVFENIDLHRWLEKNG